MKRIVEIIKRTRRPRRTRRIYFYAFAILSALALTCVTAFYLADSSERGSKGATAGRERVNVLVLGTDGCAGLCDVMMLVSIDEATNTAAVLQIPRDTYARYTESDYRKLNGACNSLGGAAQTAEWLSDALGVRIDHYVCAGLDTVSAVVDAIGGVDVYIPCDMEYRDETQGLRIDLEEGPAHLDGDGAEQFLRFRYSYVEGDVARLDAHKIFLAALYKKLSEDPTSLILAGVTTAVNGIETDMTVSDMIDLGMRVRNMDGDSIYIATLPGREAVATESGASYYVVCSDGARRVLSEYFGGCGFDSGAYFLNTRYESFEKIYFGEGEPEIFSVNQIFGDGINIATH